MNLIKIFFKQAFFGVNITQFFDTLCNNFMRNAITAAVIFGIIAVENNATVSSLMVGILMAPSFLFMATAGEIVDKYPKDLVIKILKILQLFAAVLACSGFACKNIWILLIALFCMGTFAAFLSTSKYSILPDILPKEDLLAANGLMQMMVFTAILIGTILGGIIFDGYVLYIILITASLLGLISAFTIPHQTNYSPKTVIHKNLITAIWKNISLAIKNKQITFNILAISWFWFIGTVIISQIPAFVKYVLNGNNAVFTFFMVLISVGISIGTISCQIILKGKISNKFILPCLLIIMLSLADLTYVSSHYIAPQDATTLSLFLSELKGIHITLDILIFAISGGIYIVPLTTMLQISAPNNIRARIISANNIINALFMIIGSCFCALLLLFNTSIPVIFIILSGLNGIIALFYVLFHTNRLHL